MHQSLWTVYDYGTAETSDAQIKNGSHQMLNGQTEYFTFYMMSMHRRCC